MATIGLPSGAMGVSESAGEVMRRIQACRNDRQRIAFGQGETDVQLDGWFMATSNDGESIAVQAGTVTYVKP